MKVSEECWERCLAVLRKCPAIVNEGIQKLAQDIWGLLVNIEKAARISLRFVQSYPCDLFLLLVGV